MLGNSPDSGHRLRDSSASEFPVFLPVTSIDGSQHIPPYLGYDPAALVREIASFFISQSVHYLVETVDEMDRNKLIQRLRKNLEGSPFSVNTKSDFPNGVEIINDAQVIVDSERVEETYLDGKIVLLIFEDYVIQLYKDGE